MKTDQKRILSVRQASGWLHFWKFNAGTQFSSPETEHLPWCDMLTLNQAICGRQKLHSIVSVYQPITSHLPFGLLWEDDTKIAFKITTKHYFVVFFLWSHMKWLAQSFCCAGDMLWLVSLHPIQRKTFLSVLFLVALYTTWPQKSRTRVLR